MGDIIGGLGGLVGGGGGGKYGGSGGWLRFRGFGKIGFWEFS